MMTRPTMPAPNPRRSPSGARQRGTALIVALVALVAMIAAGFAMMRSVDTVNLSANNYQFMRSAQQGVDLAMNEALMAYMQTSPNVAVRMIDRNNDTPGVAYWATQLPTNAEGIPNNLLALPTPAWTSSGPVATGWPGEQIDNTARQLRRYTVDRLCTAPGIATANNCRLYEFEYATTTASNQQANGGVEQLPFVRITVRVDGPKNSVAYAQMFLKAE